MVEKNVSPAFSFEGWNFLRWVKGNKDVLKVMVPAIFAFLSTNGMLEAAVAGIVGKAVLDIIDFYATKVKLEK